MIIDVFRNLSREEDEAPDMSNLDFWHFFFVLLAHISLELFPYNLIFFSSTISHPSLMISI